MNILLKNSKFKLVSYTETVQKPVSPLKTENHHYTILLWILEISWMFMLLLLLLNHWMLLITMLQYQINNIKPPTHSTLEKVRTTCIIIYKVLLSKWPRNLLSLDGFSASTELRKVQHGNKLRLVANTYVCLCDGCIVMK